MRMEAFNQLTPPQEAHPMEQLLDVLGNTVQFFYTCWDRIVLNGYIERLQRPENLIHFFHDVVGIEPSNRPCSSSGPMPTRPGCGGLLTSWASRS